MGGGSGATIGPAIGVAIDVLNKPFLIPALVVGSLAATYTTARLIFDRIANKRARTLRQLTEQLADEARGAIARRTVGPGASGARRALR
jgi:hypothetical protein